MRFPPGRSGSQGGYVSVNLNGSTATGITYPIASLTGYYRLFASATVAGANVRIANDTKQGGNVWAKGTDTQSGTTYISWLFVGV